MLSTSGGKSIWNHLVCCTFHAILIEWIRYSSNWESISQMCLTNGVRETLESSVWHRSHHILGYSKRLRNLFWCVGCVWKCKWLCLSSFGNCFDSVSEIWGNRYLYSSLGKYSERYSSTFQRSAYPFRTLSLTFSLISSSSQLLSSLAYFLTLLFLKHIFLSVSFIDVFSIISIVPDK